MVKTYSVKKDGDKKVSNHFKVKEFRCKDGADIVKIDSVLVDYLENIRIHFNKPVYINSGYRTLSHNRKCGSKDTSQHVKGKAADIVVQNTSPNAVYEYCITLIRKGGVGKYSTFTHIDSRGYRARW